MVRKRIRARRGADGPCVLRTLVAPLFASALASLAISQQACLYSLSVGHSGSDMARRSSVLLVSHTSKCSSRSNQCWNMRMALLAFLPLLTSCRKSYSYSNRRNHHLHFSPQRKWETYKRYHATSARKWDYTKEGQVFVEGGLVRGFPTDKAQLHLEAYRRYITELRHGRRDQFSAVQGYDLCSMCQAMYWDGSCSSPEDATDDTVDRLRASLDDLAEIAIDVKEKSYFYQAQMAVKGGRGGARKSLSDPHEWSKNLDIIQNTSRVMDEIQCEDDGELWWDTCSKLDCMNNMEGVDPSCKYHVAPDDENPLDGSKTGLYEHTAAHYSKDSVMTYVSDDFGDHRIANKSLAELPEFGVQVMLGYYQTSFTYVHAHCGAGVDQRTVSMQCHFPGKQWCVMVGAIQHYMMCGKIFCEPCLWTCKTRAQMSKLASETPAHYRKGPAIYVPSSDVLDTMLPQECIQDPNTQESAADFKISSCDDPLRNSNVVVAQPDGAWFNGTWQLPPENVTVPNGIADDDGDDGDDDDGADKSSRRKDRKTRRQQGSLVPSDEDIQEEDDALRPSLPVSHRETSHQVPHAKPAFVPLKADAQATTAGAVPLYEMVAYGIMAAIAFLFWLAW